MMLGTMKLLLSSGFLMAPNAMVGWTSANLPTIVPFCKRYCRLPVWRRHSLSVHHCILARLKTPAVGGRLQPGWPPSGDSGLMRLCEIIINADCIKI